MAEQTPPADRALEDFVLDDIPVAPAAVMTGTLSIEIVPEQAIAAGAAYERAALETAAAADPDYPPLPDEPRVLSRHGRRWRPSRTDLRFEPSGELRPSRRPLPEGLWPEVVYGLTLTAVNLGDSRAVRHRKQLEARIARPVRDGARYIPVLARQGGVGATTVTALLGMALADGRSDRVTAVDAHADRGDLAQRVDAGLTPLEIVRSAARPDGIVLTDAPASLLDPAVHAALQQADGLVVVSGGTSAQARAASDTVTWLEQNDFADLAGNTVVALNTATAGTRYESLDAIEAHFQARVRDVVRIPYDEELVAGAPARYGALRPDTRDAARDLAALVMDGLTTMRGGRAA